MDIEMAGAVTSKGKVSGIKSIQKTDKEYIIKYESGETAKLIILNSHVFRFYMSPNGEFLDNPFPNNPEDIAKICAKSTEDYDQKPFKDSSIEENKQKYSIHTNKIEVQYDKATGKMSIYDKRTSKQVFAETEPLSYEDERATQVALQREDEHFFGGGMQNGRFSHKGEIIDIVNTNNWIDGGVTSPCPFYWSSYGYGVMRHTWQPGYYDFSIKGHIGTVHSGDHFDAFYFINELPRDILNDYFELTGKPIFMPEFAFYEAHLNAFNRDYWVKVDKDTPGARLFEDGFYYKCYQPADMGDKKGILESLNGEKDNYQFSARAMVDRYKRHDMPLGWFVPNDGYGCGYGQTDSLNGDLDNLTQFADYSRNLGVECALWTESNLEPSDPEHPKKGERDLKREVGEAGVVALKCDVAWIGEGYSFGLNAVENAGNIFKGATNGKHRPLIIMVDGWAGTQRHAGIWSGDQTGGQWEYIRFHIPTYIGTGLSGQPTVGSDMDGIYGGKDKSVNIRDYQWKTFTPMQLSMDGWGTIAKTPFSFDEEATDINRAYLKLKSMLMPYNYTLGHESTHGLPLIRAMFLEFPKEMLAYGKDSQYEYMWGPYILVAPVYNSESIMGNSIRHGIYLPDKKQVWVDFFTGEKYQGGKIYNNIITPIWKIPVFVRDGAIIPFTNPNNNPSEIKRDERIFNIYPNGETSFEVYEDDGISSGYLNKEFSTSKITTIGPKSNESGDLLLNIHKTVGIYNNQEVDRKTLLQIMTTEFKSIKAAINGKSVVITAAETEEEFNSKDNVCYLKKDFIINPYLAKLGQDFLKQSFLLIKLQKTDVTVNDITIKVNGFANVGNIFGANNKVVEIDIPTDLKADENEITPTSAIIQWQPVEGVDYYEIERDGEDLLTKAIFSNVIGTSCLFDGFKYQSTHTFRIRSVTKEGVSEWSQLITVETKEDPKKHAVKGVKVTCNLPCQPCQEVSNLTDPKCRSIWHTLWGDEGKATNDKPILLHFDLGDVYELEKVEYTPREDGGKGNILEMQYRFSTDGKIWTPMSEKIMWEYDATTKILDVKNAKMRYFELNILKSVREYGSGKQVTFYKKIN